MRKFEKIILNPEKDNIYNIINTRSNVLNINKNEKKNPNNINAASKEDGNEKKELERKETYEKLMSGFFINNTPSSTNSPENSITNSLRKIRTADGITIKEVDYVFQSVKEEIVNNNKLENENIKEENNSHLIHFSRTIKEDNDLKELTQTVKKDYGRLSKIVNDPNNLNPVDDPFGIKRGICEICIDDCKGYSPANFEFNNLPSLCSNCNCGASAHKPLEMDNMSYNTFITSIKNDILPTLHKPNLSDDHLNFNSFLAVFKLDSNNSGINNIEVNCFIKILKDGGFKIISSKIQNFSDNNLNENYQMIRSNLDKYYQTSNKENNYNIADSVNLNKYEINKLFLKDAYKFVSKKDTTFERLNKYNSFVQNYQLGDEYNINNEGIDIAESANFVYKSLAANMKNSMLKSMNNMNTSQIKNNIHSNIEVKPKYLENFKNNVLTLCLSCNSNSTFDSNNSRNIIGFFEKFYYSIKNNNHLKYAIPPNINLIYYSKSKTMALWDLQSIFPDLFKIHTNISILFEKPNFFENENLFNSTVEQHGNFAYSQIIKNSKNNFNSYLKSSNLNFQKTKQINFNQSQNTNGFRGLNLNETIYINDQNKEPNNYINDQGKITKFDLFKQQLSHFQDYLISNSLTELNVKTYTSILLLIEELKKFSDSGSSFVNNFINYVNKYTSHNNTLHCSLSLLSKIGNLNSFNPFGLFDKFDILSIKNDHEKEILSDIFFTSNSVYSRVMLIFRPIIIRNGLNDTIINIFKLNDFSILKRKILVLDENMIDALYYYENLNQMICFEDYSKMMTDSNIEIIILSKFNAIDDANMICGSTNNINQNLKNSINSILSQLELNVQFEVKNDLIHKDDKIKKQKYEEQIYIDPQSNSSNLNNSPFDSITALINLNHIFSNILTENKNNVDNYNSYVSIKNNLLKFCTSFNIFAYNTKSLKSVDEEINYFFPEFGDMQEILIFVKPACNDNLSNLPEMIKQTYIKMNFEIVDMIKYRLNEDEFGNLFDKYLTNNLISALDYSNSKELLLNNDLEILRMVKPGGMLDLNKIITRENYFFVRDSYISSNLDKLRLLKDNSYLLSLSSDIENFYPIINSNVSIIEGDYLIKNADKVNIEDFQNQNHTYNNLNISNISVNTYTSSSLIIQVLNSCIKCTLGENLRFDFENNIKEKLIQRFIKFYHYDDDTKINEYFINILNHYMFSKWNISQKTNDYNERFFEFLKFNKDFINTQIAFFVESNNLGFYEVRIPIMENITQFTIDETIDINLALHYLYIDDFFYQEINNKNEGLKIYVEKMPFNIETVGEKEIKHILNINNIPNENKYENNNNNDFNELKLSQQSHNFQISRNSINFSSSINKSSHVNVNKVMDNLHIIKKRLFYKTKYECNKLFYKMCNFICLETDHIILTPKNYHYRIKPDDITMDIRRIYEVEEFSGLYFIEVVTQDLMKYRPPEYIQSENNYIYNKEFRYSLPAYLWGRKMAKICQKLESTAARNYINNNIANCGPLVFSSASQNLTGIISSKNLYEYDQYLYINILYDLKIAHDNKKEIDFEIFTEEQYLYVENKLIDVLHSDAFLQSRSEENIRLVPSRVTEHNLRINKKQNTYCSEDDVNEFIDNADYEIKFHDYFKKNEEGKINNDIANKNILLVDLFCVKGSKYRTYAGFQYLLNVILKKLSRKSFLINNDEIEYDKMIDALLTGFNININFDNEFNNDKKEFNTYKIEYFLYCITEMKFILNELSVFKIKVKNIEQNINALYRNTQNYNNNILQIQENERLLQILRNNINELNMNLEIIFYEILNCEVKHKILVKENNKLYIVPKERYHIPMYFNEYWEKDLKHEKYNIKKATEQTFLMDINTVKNTASLGEKELFNSSTLRVFFY